MKNLRIPVILATIYVLVYSISPDLGFPVELIVLMFTFSPIVVIWLAIYILRHGKESEKKWDDGHWYDDFNINQIGE